MELFLAVTLALAAVPTPSGIELERLVDNSYEPPGVVGLFGIQRVPPVLCGDRVLFNGDTFLDFRSGVYSASSEGVEVIANPGTRVPGSGEFFHQAWQQACAGGRVVFLGSATPELRRSVYLWTAGTLAPVIEKGIRLGGSEVLSFNRLSGSEFGVAMIARLGLPVIMNAIVIKPFQGNPFIVADETTILPGQTNPMDLFRSPVLMGSDLVFYAETGFNFFGIYRWTHGQGFSVVADIQTPVPLPGAGTFGIFDVKAVSLDEGIVFAAGFSGGFGIFIERAGQLEPFVVPGQTTESGETITSARMPSGAGSLLVFEASTVERPATAIFVRTHDGRLLRILGLDDTFDGQPVDFLQASADRSSVAIRVNNKVDPQQVEVEEVLYRARFPEPRAIPALSRPALAALAGGLAGVGLWILRRIRCG